MVHAFRGDSAERHNNPFLCLSQAAAIVALAHATQQRGVGEETEQLIILVGVVVK